MQKTKIKIGQFLQKLKVRKYHLQAFARHGSSVFDCVKLALLGWHKTDATNNSPKITKGQWSAKLKTINHKEVSLCPDDACHVGIFEEMFVYNGYDLDLPDFEPEIVLDVGAHIGLFSVAASGRWPNALILAFEPHPDNAVWARQNFNVNKIQGCVFEAAASIKSGLIDFDARSGMGQVGLCEDSIRVKAVDLETLIQSFSTFGLLLKMDIEGGEKELLPIILPCLPPKNAVYVEIHGTLSECEKMLEVIKNCEFKIHPIKHRCSENGDQHFMDLFLRPDEMARLVDPALKC